MPARKIDMSQSMKPPKTRSIDPNDQADSRHPGLRTLGIRHVALNVTDPQNSKAFYQRVLGMEVEWEPDPENVYLTSKGEDNLALHKASRTHSGDGESPFQQLDHIGFALDSMESVDQW